jgi:hypothetical protein
MYFWRIEKLKTELAARPLSEREVLPYVVVFVALSVAAGFIPHPTRNIWDELGAVWSVLLAAVATIYIYRQNGGAGGQHFLQRYIAVSWVVSIRWFVFLSLAALAFYSTLAALRADRTSRHWYDFLFYASIQAVIYWRVGHHVRDIAQRTRAA